MNTESPRDLPRKNRQGQKRGHGWANPDAWQLLHHGSSPQCVTLQGQPGTQHRRRHLPLSTLRASKVRVPLSQAPLPDPALGGCQELEGAEQSRWSPAAAARLGTPASSGGGGRQRRGHASRGQPISRGSCGPGAGTGYSWDRHSLRGGRCRRSRGQAATRLRSREPRAARDGRHGSCRDSPHKPGRGSLAVAIALPLK